MKKISLFIVTAVLLVLMTGCQNNTAPAQSQSQTDSAIQTDSAAQEGSSIQTDSAVQEDSGTQTDSTVQAGSVAGDGVAIQPDSSIRTEENTETAQKDMFTNLEIEVSEGKIDICSGETFSLTRHNGASVDYEINGETLYVTASHKDEIVLVLPEDKSYGALNLIVGSGHAYVEGSVTVDRFTLQVAQGETSVEGISVLENSYILVETGSASVHGDMGASVTAECRQGHLGLAIPFEESDYNYELKVSGGNIHLGSHNYNGKSASRTIDNNSERTMNLSCTHGELSVEFNR